MKTLFHVNGPLIWLDDDGEPSCVFDAYTVAEALRAHYDGVGIGADPDDTQIRQLGGTIDMKRGATDLLSNRQRPRPASPRPGRSSERHRRTWPRCRARLDAPFR